MIRSNAQAKGLAHAAGFGPCVPRWREAHPEWVHRRGKRCFTANLSGKADSEGIQAHRLRGRGVDPVNALLETAMSALLTTPLHTLHPELGAKTVPFAIY